MKFKGMFYTIEGKEMTDVIKWAKYMAKVHEDGSFQIGVKKFWWGGVLSTVYLGTNYNFWRTNPPIIFESMIFTPFGNGLMQTRYSTKELAEKGHKQLVLQWFIPYMLAWEPIDDLIFDLKLKWFKWRHKK